MKNKIPKIRFKGFDEEWENSQLGEIGKTYTGLSGKTKEDFGHGDGEFVTYMNVFSNPIANPEMVEPVEIDKKQNEVEFGDVFFTTSSETPEEVGMSSVWIEDEKNVYLNSFCFGYRPTEKLDNFYMAYMLRSSSMRKNITFLAQGISRYNISKNRVMDISIHKPTLKEQTKIGNFFQKLDKLIERKQNKYDKLQNIKKAMLEKMFPKNGANTPQIRFKGFNDEWVEKRLESICSMNARIGWQNLRTSEFLDNGDYYLITGTDFDNGRINFNTCHYVEKYRYIQDRKIQVNNGSILITKDGTLGKVAYVEDLDKPATLNAGVFNVRTKSKNIDEKYIFQYLKAPFLMNYVSEKATGGTIKHLNQNILVDFPVKLPNKPEQTKISNYFQKLDKLLSLQKQELEKLKNIKKAMLEKMFV